MNFIKYKGVRINLDQVPLYQAGIVDGSPAIVFLTTAQEIDLENSEIPLSSWKFDSEEKRDEVLKRVDRAAKVSDVAEKSSGGTTKLEGL